MGWTRPRSSQANGRAGRVDQCLLQVGAAPNPYPLVAPRVKDHRVHYPVPAFVYLTSLTPRSRCAVQDARDRSRSMLTEMQPVDPAGADPCEGHAAGEAPSIKPRRRSNLKRPRSTAPGTMVHRAARCGSSAAQDFRHRQRHRKCKQERQRLPPLVQGGTHRRTDARSIGIDRFSRVPARG